MKETPAQRLATAREAAGYKSAAAFAKAFDLTESAYRHHENGTRNIPMEAAKRYGKMLGVDWQWFFIDNAQLDEGVRHYRGPAANSGMVEMGGNEFARIPVYDIRIAAGVGAQNHEETPIDYYVISMSLLRGISNSPLKYIAGLQVMGDSMEPTLHNKDWVLVDMHQTKLTREGIYALNFEGDAIVKRASQHLETRAVTLTSDNPKYPAQTIKKPDRLSVIGRVILSIRRH